ncbi:MAG: metallophosphoesterase [Pseudomonadota bacterium]|nr:metallophosphoesterase [Pseudomonadota bacterium]
MPGFLDGPVVRRSSGNTWAATWYCEDRVGTTRGSGDSLRLECAGKEHLFPFHDVVAPAQGPMPARVAVLSDLEGNVAFLDAALPRLDVTDDDGNWSYGDGHLVILGDSVDRGRDVFAVLWRLHALAAQAGEAGGAVHVLLGNHEQYMLRTNPSRASHDHLHALNAMGGYRQAFAGDTVIGGWLRQQPVVLKLGDVLFVHAGVSPEVAGSGLSLEQLNAAMRDYWSTPASTGEPSAAYDAVLGQDGVTQYRGYFRAMEGKYPKAGSDDVQRALDHFDASRIVVAHTIVDGVQRLFDGRILAVDVNHDQARQQALVFENGMERIVDIGIGRNIGDGEGQAFRDFSLSDDADRAMLRAMIRDIRRLSALPYPY